MANINETEQWETGIYQLETTDPVEGGADGVDNTPHKHLANRTLWLKAQIEAVQNTISNFSFAALAGSATQKFKVATATANDEAVNKLQAETIAAEFGIGKVLQVVTKFIGGVSGTSSGETFIATQSFTPSKTVSKIIVELSGIECVNGGVSNSLVGIRIKVDGNTIMANDTQSRNFTFSMRTDKAIYSNTNGQQIDISVYGYSNSSGSLYFLENHSQLIITEVE